MCGSISQSMKLIEDNIYLQVTPLPITLKAKTETEAAGIIKRAMSH